MNIILCITVNMGKYENTLKKKLSMSNIPKIFIDKHDNICIYDYTDVNDNFIYYYNNENNDKIYFEFNFDLVGKQNIFIDFEGQFSKYIYTNIYGEWCTYKENINQSDMVDLLFILDDFYK